MFLLLTFVFVTSVHFFPLQVIDVLPIWNVLQPCASEIACVSAILLIV